jgi:hypothetical protein
MHIEVVEVFASTSCKERASERKNENKREREREKKQCV